MLGFLKSPSQTPGADVLRAERLYLRAPRTGDWKAWAELRGASRAFLEPWEPTWPRDALSRAAFRNRLQRQARELRDGTGHGFFLFRNDDHALLGGITLSNIQRGIAMSCSVGYWVGERHARQGVMTEALGRLLPFVFDSLGLHRLEAACLPDNLASQALLHKLGFEKEGYARAYLRINGRWHDHLLFALLASDFRARRVNGKARATRPSSTGSDKREA